jgi:hypothetical protein
MPERRIAMPDTSLPGPWVRRFLIEHLVSERNLARNTQRSYRDALRLLLPMIARCVRKPLDRLALTDLSPDRLRRFLGELEEKRGSAISTRNQRLAAIHDLARSISVHAPELVEWCGQIRIVPFKKAPRSLVAYLEKPETAFHRRLDVSDIVPGLHDGDVDVAEQKLQPVGVLEPGGIQGGECALLLLAEVLDVRKGQSLKELRIGLDLAAQEVAHRDLEYRQPRPWAQSD